MYMYINIFVKQVNRLEDLNYNLCIYEYYIRGVKYGNFNSGMFLFSMVL